MKAVNDRLEQEQNFLMKIGGIDTKGFTDSEKMSHDMLLTDLADDIEGSEFKEWEMPVNQMGGIYSTYPQLVAELSFNDVKDYDDWIARLKLIPTAFAQVTQNMEIGMEDHRVPPKYLLEKALEQVKQLANQKPEDSPLALPLKKFPASIPQADQERIRTEMLSVIAKKVLPAYQQFARFMEVSYVPAGRADPGVWALPDGAEYYKYLIRQTTTTDLTADQIHKIGEEEVAKDEAEMLAISQEARLSGSEELPGQPEDQSQAASGVARGTAGRLPGLPGADEGQAAATVRQVAQGAV